ncbi:MAG: c-type cytochrome [Vibrio sp.]|uniref:c-type cytochrome n=1 Tax=Vibrio sp. TaxID=678 RepID=UPI003F37A7C1
MNFRLNKATRFRHPLTHIALTLGLALIVNPALASGNAQLGEQKVSSCLFCHAKDDEASHSRYPNLNGKSAPELYQAMKEYQLGERSGPMAEMMKAQLRRFNDQDLHDVAAFYATTP